MKEQVKNLIRNHEELQEDIKNFLANQLININLLVKKEKELLDKYDKNIDIDLLYKMYIKVLNNISVEELIKLIEPMKSTSAYAKVEMENLFDNIMKKLKDMDFNNEYENTYRDYIIEKYNSKKSMFIPKEYLKDKAKCSEYSKDKNNISINLEVNRSTLNNKGGEYYYEGSYREAVVEWDEAIKLQFRSYDSIFGGTFSIITIPYEHRKDYYDNDDRRENIDIGYTNEIREFNDNPIKKISELIKKVEKKLNKVELYLRLYIEDFKEEELLEYQSLQRTYKKRLKKLLKLQKAILENKLESTSLSKIYK